MLPLIPKAVDRFQIVSIDALQQRQHAGLEEVVQAVARPRIEEFLKVLAPHIEGDAEVEEEAGRAVLEQDLVAADLTAAAVEVEFRHGKVQPAIQFRSTIAYKL